MTYGPEGHKARELVAESNAIRAKLHGLRLEIEKMDDELDLSDAASIRYQALENAEAETEKEWDIFRLVNGLSPR